MVVSPVSVGMLHFLLGEKDGAESCLSHVDGDSGPIRRDEDSVMGALLASCRAVPRRGCICRTCFANVAGINSVTRLIIIDIRHGRPPRGAPMKAAKCHCSLDRTFDVWLSVSTQTATLALVE